MTLVSPTMRAHTGRDGGTLRGTHNFSTAEQAGRVSAASRGFATRMAGGCGQAAPIHEKALRIRRRTGWRSSVWSAEAFGGKLAATHEAPAPFEEPMRCTGA